jgi:hypothetical protein
MRKSSFSLDARHAKGSRFGEARHIGETEVAAQRALQRGKIIAQVYRVA